jgi:hypothetical protein
LKLTTYTETQKLDALKLWLVVGNLHQVGRDLKIPLDTLKKWRYSRWWADLSVEIKSEGRLELSAKLRKVAEKALGETLDRLENGDVRISPTGDLQKVPVSAAVAAKIATDFLQKSTELERVQDNESLQTLDDRLKALADNFEKFSRKVRKIEVEDAPSDGESPEEGRQEEGIIEGEDGSLRLRYDEKDGMDTFDAEAIEKAE